MLPMPIASSQLKIGFSYAVAAVAASAAIPLLGEGKATLDGCRVGVQRAEE